MEAPGDYIDVSELIDDCGVNKFNVRVTALAALVVLVEGYDITAMAFALPGLMKSWHIASAAELGPLLSASIVGMLIGSPLFGYLGDRYGRKTWIVGACGLFGIFTGMVLLANTISQLFTLRLLAGVGLGGAAPNVIALVSEYAPRKRRAMIVTIMFSAIGLGGALPGLISSVFVAAYGWRSLFWIGTVIPIVVAVVCLALLPESAKFLVVKSRHAEALKILCSLDPIRMSSIAPGKLIVGQERNSESSNVRQLFADGFAPLTILFWIVAAGNFMTFTVLQSWTPALLGMAKVPPHLAALAQSTFQIGGVTGGAFVGRLLDAKGPLMMAVIMTLAIPPTIAIGLIDPQQSWQLFTAEFLSGLCVLGTAYGIGGFASVLYPTSNRSNGAGWALGLGRLGSILGTVAIGLLLALDWKVNSLFLVTSVPLGTAAAACFGLAYGYEHRVRRGEEPAFSGEIEATRFANS